MRRDRQKKHKDRYALAPKEERLKKLSKFRSKQHLKQQCLVLQQPFFAM